MTKLRRVKHSIASMGLRRGLADVVTWLVSYDPALDQSFDRRFATDTAGSVAPAQLGISDTTARDNAILYLPSPERVTRWMLANVAIDHRQYSFVDLGCGKGRVVLVASEFPFARVVGVEISPELTGIARRNISRYQPTSRACQDVTVQNVDATTFDFPLTNLLVHLYHPFEPALTTAVLSRLEQSVRAHPRQVVIAYLFYASARESIEAVFGRFPWLRQTRTEQSVLGHYDWLFYST
jgi:SAM-dependent methyltransferase